MSANFDGMIRVLLKESPPPSQPGWLPPPAAPDPNVRGPIVNGQQIIKSLRRHFTPKELAAAGILEPLGKNPTKHQINAQLTGDSLWVALQDKAGLYFDILGRQGCLRQNGPAIVNTMADHHVRSGVDAGETLFVTMDVADMALLRSLNFAATTAHCLDRIGGSALHQFGTFLGEPGILIDDPSEELPDELQTDDLPAASPPEIPQISELVLVAWSPARGDVAEPAGVEAVIAHLQNLHVHLRLGFHKVFVWRPAPVDLESLAFACRFGAREQLADAMFRLMKPKLRPIITTKPLPKMTLADAILGFRRTHDETMRKELRQSLFETIERPVLERAQQTHDGLEAGRQLLAAQTISEIVEHLEERKIRRSLGDRAALQISEREQERKELQTLLGLLKLIPKPAYDGLPDLSTAELARFFATNAPKPPVTT